jgi:hypothetical protein
MLIKGLQVGALSAYGRRAKTNLIKFGHLTRGGQSLRLDTARVEFLRKSTLRLHIGRRIACS